MEGYLLTWLDWLPAGVTTSVLVVVLFFMRNYFAEWVKKSVSAHYDKELTVLSSDLRKSEAQFQAEINARDKQIAAIRDGALSSLHSREMVLYQEKVSAVRQFWECVNSLGPAKNVSSLMAVIKYDEFLKATRDNPLYVVVATALDHVDVSRLSTSLADSARPFVTPLLWAYFSAYRTILLNAVMRVQFLKSGSGEDFTNIESIKNVVKEVLPHQKEFIDNNNLEVLFYLVEELEECILAEMKNILDGEAISTKNIEQASKINKAVQTVVQQTSSAGC
ncbi:hypothetical protein [Kistimonas asteriae]|uniref:hypothetical protein n=1 Tax=Kistimonas asteriae TaxID=517724 RepID=UPI001BA574E5|nr:hypothetical protein [Kistimonas asteriae]